MSGKFVSRREQIKLLNDEVRKWIPKVAEIDESHFDADLLEQCHEALDSATITELENIGMDHRDDFQEAYTLITVARELVLKVAAFANQLLTEAKVKIRDLEQLYKMEFDKILISPEARSVGNNVELRKAYARTQLADRQEEITRWEIYRERAQRLLDDATIKSGALKDFGSYARKQWDIWSGENLPFGASGGGSYRDGDGDGDSEDGGYTIPSNRAQGRSQQVPDEAIDLDDPELFGGSEE